MKNKTLWAAVAAVIVAMVGCMKAGDGIGLTDKGARMTFCQMNPQDPTCVVDPCIANPSLPQCVVDTCKTTPPAAGCTLCQINPNDPSCLTPPKVKFDKVLAILLSEAAKCSQCHLTGGVGAGAGKLLLTADSAYANLVNAPVAQVSIAQKGWVRVKPGSPDSSYFFLKISMPTPKLPDGTPIGARMPQYNNALDTGSINLIKQWILDGAEK